MQGRPAVLSTGLATGGADEDALVCSGPCVVNAGTHLLIFHIAHPPEIPA